MQAAGIIDDVVPVQRPAHGQFTINTVPRSASINFAPRMKSPGRVREPPRPGRYTGALRLRDDRLGVSIAPDQRTQAEPNRMSGADSSFHFFRHAPARAAAKFSDLRQRPWHVRGAASSSGVKGLGLPQAR